MKILFGVLLSSLICQAIVWRGDLEEVESKQVAEMTQVGKVYYSPLRVFGGSCLAMGGKWVVTSRHGTEKWPAGFLGVEFPGMGEGKYAVEKVVFPEKGDYALLKLKQEVKKANVVKLFEGDVVKGQRVWIGGFGKSGPVGKIGGGGKFFSGHNKIDGLRGGKISISLSKPDDASVEKDEAILALFDSGSPLFVETKNGWLLAGVASTASNGKNPGYGDRGNYARLKDGADWMRKMMAGK